jgi:hypothetical protein
MQTCVAKLSSIFTRHSPLFSMIFVVRRPLATQPTSYSKCRRPHMLQKKHFNLRCGSEFLSLNLKSNFNAVRERHHQNVQNRFLKARDQYVRFRFCPSGEDAITSLEIHTKTVSTFVVLFIIKTVGNCNITFMFAIFTITTNDLQYWNVRFYYINQLEMSLTKSPQYFAQYYYITLLFCILRLYYPF